MKADLHSHTVLSDGALDVDWITRQAKRIGLDYFSITDHNSTHSIPALKALGEELDLNVIPGVEITAYHAETGIKPHILCYFPVDIKRMQRKLDKYLKIQTAAKTEEYKLLMKDYPITFEQLDEVSRHSTAYFETHMAQVLALLGYTGTPIGDLHNELFSPGSKYKVPQEDIPLPDAVDLIRSCGGVIVLAHPGQYKNPMFMEMLIEKNYLDGIELNHPRNDEKTKSQIQSLAKEHDLFVTGGTDFHGLYTKTPYPLGSYLCPEEGLERLLEAGKIANDNYYKTKESNVDNNTENKVEKSTLVP